MTEEVTKPSMVDLLVEVHEGLDRLGPGSDEATERALSFVDGAQSVRRVVDMGCGTGAAAFALAHLLPDADITGVDMFPQFVERFNERAAVQGVEGRVRGVACSMEEVPFEPGSLDLIWSEGVLDGPAVARVTKYWNALLRPGGYLAFTSPSWLDDEHPDDIARFWADAEAPLNTVDATVAELQAAGYAFVGAFTLAERDWLENYFDPREAAGAVLAKKYAGSETAEAFLALNAREVSLYREHKQHYGYVFYIVRKR